MNYIKLNNNNEHLSLGNLFNIIKKLSINKSNTTQTEIFCILFNIDNISDTTVGNYCTGYRAIGNDYKQIYINYKKHYEKDKKTLINTINNLIIIMEGYGNNHLTVESINNNPLFQKLCINIIPLIKNDIYIPINTKRNFLTIYENKNYYEFFSEMLFYIILEKIQPIHESDLVKSTIEEILENTNMSVIDLKDYLEIKFKEGISLIPSLKKLTTKNNPYAMHELGNMEYNGLITGKPRYEEAYNYYLKAANYNYPASCWMISYMIINKKIGSLSHDDILLAWTYLNKAYNLDSISAINTMGLCYKYGYTPEGTIDINKAIDYFEKAANKNYIYAYNNLGKIYEEQNNIKKAIEYYKISAEAEDSWACNKLGLLSYEGKYIEKNLSKALNYFKTGANAPIASRIPWNIYNLVKLFYLPGNATLGIKKDISKSLELLETISNFTPAYELFLYCYYELYLENKTDEYLNKINYYLNLVNNTFDNNIKKEIETHLKKIHNYQIKIDL